MKWKQKDFFKLSVNTSGEVPEILLYGYIGTVRDIWGDKLEDESNSDTDVIQALTDLEKTHSRINIRINSPGGSMKHGLSIINAMRRSPAEITTYNDGFALSMGFDIWLAGHKRKMSNTTVGMCHPPISALHGNAQAHRDEGDRLDKLAETTISLLADCTGMSKEEVHKKFYADYKDHWITAEDALELGLIDEVETYEAAPLPNDPEKMSISELLGYFSRKGDEASKNVLKQLTNIKQRVLDAIVIPPFPAKSTNIKQMKIEDLKKSLDSGELSREDVAALLEVKKEEPEEKPGSENTDDTADVAKLISDAVEKAVKPLTEKVSKLETKLEEQGAKPGADATDVHKEKDTDATKGLDAQFRETMTGMLDDAEKGGRFSKSY